MADRETVRLAKVEDTAKGLYRQWCIKHGHADANGDPLKPWSGEVRSVLMFAAESYLPADWIA